MRLIIRNKKVLFASLPIAGLAASVFLLTPDASAQIESGLQAAGGQMDSGASVDSIVANVVNLFLYVVGVVAVIMIIFGGFQYITSAGDSAKAGKARNTILYAVVGLVLAAIAYAIINFVMDEVVS